MKASKTEIRKELKSFIDENGYDLHKSLPSGASSKMKTHFGVSTGVLNYELQIIRGTRKDAHGKKCCPVSRDDIDNRSSCSLITEYLLTHDDDITKKLPRGRGIQIAKDLGIKYNTFMSGFRKLKKSKGIIIIKDGGARGKKLVKHPVSKTHPIKKYCVDNKFIRSSPTKEYAACQSIIKSLFGLPSGGGGMIIGTPSVFSACSSDKYSLVSIDNMEVALALKWTTDITPTLVIGNAVEPAKAQVKANDWAMMNSTSKFNIILDKVYRDSFTRHISMFAEKNKIAKVVLMMSGAWACSIATKIKYGMDLNFKDPSEYLTNVFPNLHIIAMTRKARGFNFEVRYVYRGKNELIS